MGKSNAKIYVQSSEGKVYDEFKSFLCMTKRQIAYLPHNAV